jgi:hypothetical protein
MRPEKWSGLFHPCIKILDNYYFKVINYLKLTQVKGGPTVSTGSVFVTTLLSAHSFRHYLPFSQECEFFFNCSEWPDQWQNSLFYWQHL